MDMEMNQKTLHEFAHIQQVLQIKLSNKKHQVAIYGTGDGACLVYSALKNLDNIEFICFIDRDDKVSDCKLDNGESVYRLDYAIDKVDSIIISSKINHIVVKKRVVDYLQKIESKRIIIDVFGDDWNTDADKIAYVDYLENYKSDYADTFVNFTKYDYDNKNDVKLIAWYLPQFYQMDVNDKYHGKGYTEWTSATQAFPVFTGHYQPHIPYDLGFYNLLNPDVIRRQVELANNYGIYGFCMHYYWFQGEQVMTKPIDIIMQHKDIDFKFFFNWANENWTTIWDDSCPNIIYEQKYPIDASKFMQDILPYMKDDRYIKIDGKPILSVYRCHLMKRQDCLAMINVFRQEAQKVGFKDLYIITTTASSIKDPVSEWGFDAMVEFPPHRLSANSFRPDVYINPNYYGMIYDMDNFIKDKNYFKVKYNSKCFRSSMISYDNTARRMTAGASIYLGLNPDTYKHWLKDNILYTRKHFDKNERFTFINSWNEWGEGQHLEPDMKYGYAYLQSTRNALEETIQ